MFGWFKKTQKVEDTEAYKMGQQFSQATMAAVDEFMSARFDPVFNSYLGVFNGCLDTVYKDEAPPITVARIEFNIFRENVDDLRDKMAAEVKTAMCEWINTADVIGSRDVLEKYISKVIDDYHTKLWMAGFQTMIDRADELKAGDDKWRQANPERAAQFPIDEKSRTENEDS